MESSLQRALLAAQTADDNRGRDIVVLDMRELTPVFDYFVIASGTSRRQLHAISEEIDHVLEKQLGDRRLGIEGYEESRWILLDYGDVVIHLFEPETRAYYAMEELWAGRSGCRSSRATPRRVARRRGSTRCSRLPSIACHEHSARPERAFPPRPGRSGRRCPKPNCSS